MRWSLDRLERVIGRCGEQVNSPSAGSALLIAIRQPVLSTGLLPA